MLDYIQFAVYQINKKLDFFHLTFFPGPSMNHANTIWDNFQRNFYEIVVFEYYGWYMAHLESFLK